MYFSEQIGKVKITTMEEKIFLKLQSGLTNSSLSERTIRAAAKRMALKVTEESQITDEFITDGVELLKELNGQLGKDVAKIVKEQLEKIPVPPVPPIVPVTTDSPIADVLKRVSEMEAKFQESQKQNRMLSIRNKTAEILKSKKADKDYILENTLNKVEIAEGDTAESLAEKCIPIYDNEFKKAYGEGSVPRGSENTPAAPDATKLEEFKKSKGIGVPAKK